MLNTPINSNISLNDASNDVEKTAFCTSFEEEINLITDPIKKEMATTLLNSIMPVTHRSDKEAGTYGWIFKQNKQNNPQEMTITFLGTGSMPYFAEHDVISAGGDVLCQTALQKGLDSKTPSIFIKGLGTKKLNNNVPNDSFYPIHSLLNRHSEYAGGAGGNALGRGTQRRLSVAVEEFFLPNLISMILKNRALIDNSNEKITLTTNIVGHSRGAMTSFYMADLINNVLNYIKQNGAIDITCLATKYGVSKSDINYVLDVIGADKVNCELKILAFDPVEGQYKMGGEISTWATDRTNTRMQVTVEGLGTIVTQCNEMPACVKDAQIFVAESERRSAFQPTIPSFHANTQTAYKMKIGTHSLMTGNVGTDDGPTLKNPTGNYSSFNHQFIREASHAVVDEVKLDTTEFLFDEKNLPPLQMHTLQRIFRESEFAYHNTKAFLNQKIAENANNASFNQIKNELEMAENRDDKEYREYVNIKCAQWLMQQDSDLTQKVYFLLRNDIYEMFLNPNDKRYKSQLSAWQNEMKQDTTTVTAQRMGISYQIPLLSERGFYHRHEKQCKLKPMSDLFSHFGDPLKHRKEVGGQHEADKFYDPNLILLSEYLNVKNYHNGVQNELLLDLDIAFSKVLKLLVKEAQKLNKSIDSQEHAAQNIQKAIIIFFEKLQQSNLSDLLQKIALDTAIDIMQLYAPDNSVNYLSAHIPHHDLNSVKSRLDNNLRQEILVEVQIALSMVMAELKKYNEAKNEAGKNPHACDLHRAMQDLHDNLTLNNIEQSLIEFRDKMKAAASIRATGVMGWSRGGVSVFSQKINELNKELTKDIIKWEEKISSPLSRKCSIQ